MKNVILCFGGIGQERTEILTIISQVFNTLRENNYFCSKWDLYERLDLPDEIHSSNLLIIDPFYEKNNEIHDIRHQLEHNMVEYFGPKLYASFLLSNKLNTKTYFCSPDIKTIPFLVCSTIFEVSSAFQILNTNKLVLKPISSGNSTDVILLNYNKFKKQEFTVSKLLNKYSTVLVEKFIKGVEISAPVLLSPKHIEFHLVESELVGKEIIDSEAKEHEGYVHFHIPARIDASTAATIHDSSKSIYSKVEFSGLMRCDYLLTNENLYLLEVNSYPSLGLNEGISVPAAIRNGYGHLDVILAILGEN